MYTKALPMEVSALDIGDLIRKTPGAHLHKVRFTSPGKRARKGELPTGSQMKRVLVLSGTPVDFTPLTARLRRQSWNWN